MEPLNKNQEVAVIFHVGAHIAPIKHTLESLKRIEPNAEKSGFWLIASAETTFVQRLGFDYLVDQFHKKKRQGSLDNAFDTCVAEICAQYGLSLIIPASLPSPLNAENSLMFGNLRLDC